MYITLAEVFAKYYRFTCLDFNVFIVFVESGYVFTKSLFFESHACTESYINNLRLLKYNEKLFPKSDHKHTGEK